MYDALLACHSQLARNRGDMTPFFVAFRDYLADSSSESESEEENKELPLKKAISLFVLASSMNKRRRLVQTSKLRNIAAS